MYTNGYPELTKLPPEAYLGWENFVTEHDAANIHAGVGVAQYQKGLDFGREAIAEGGHIFISANGCWGSTGKGLRTSYEGIGYHANTADLLHGFLDSGAVIIVHRYTDPDSDGTKIKG